MPGKKEEKPVKEGEGKVKENKPAAPKNAAAKKDAAPKKEAAAKKPAAPKEGSAKKPAAPKDSVAKKGAAKKKLGAKKNIKKDGGRKGGRGKEEKGKEAPKGTKVVEKRVRNKRFVAIFDTKKKRRVDPKKPSVIGREQYRNRDLSRYIKWPRVIRVQKQKKILMMRLKVPPTIFQFTKTLNRTQAIDVLTLANKYRTETFELKKKRLLAAAKKKASGEATVTSKRPLSIIGGVNAVTRAVEQKRAKLVVIAHDVDPIELVVWLPNLCRRLGVPYVIIKGKSRLGTLVHRKTCSAVAFTSVRNEDEQKLKGLADLAKELFNENADIRKQWGGGVLSKRRLDFIAKRQRIVASEIAARTTSK